MKKDRINATIIGVFYITAAVSSVIAVILYQPVLNDNWYLAVANGKKTAVTVGVLNDLILIVSAVGTGLMLFPYLRKKNDQIALGHLCFRFLEAVIITIGVITILALLQLSESFTLGHFRSTEDLKAAGELLQTMYRWTATLGPNFMLGINTFLYSYLLRKTALVPKKLASFGMITAVSVFVAGLLEVFQAIESFSALKGILALPVGVFEISLALVLILKGFRKQGLELLE